MAGSKNSLPSYSVTKAPSSNLTFLSLSLFLTEAKMATRDGGIKSSTINGIKMYTIASQQPSLASWLPTKKQSSHRAVKSTSPHLTFCLRFYSFFSYSLLLLLLLLGYTQNVQLLEDLRFRTATTKIKATPDGEYIIASGNNMMILAEGCLILYRLCKLRWKIKIMMISI